MSLFETIIIAIVALLGVIFGTLSSLFVAAPVAYKLMGRKQK